MYTPLEQTRCAHWDAATPAHFFLLHFLLFLLFDFFLFSVPFGGRGGKRNGRVINKNQFSCCLSPFAFSVGTTYGALLDTGGRRDVRKGRCEEGEM